MAVYSAYKKQSKRALYWWTKGLRAPTIAALLRKDGLKVSRVGIHEFLRQYQVHGTIGR